MKAPGCTYRPRDPIRGVEYFPAVDSKQGRAQTAHNGIVSASPMDGAAQEASKELWNREGEGKGKFEIVDWDRMDQQRSMHTSIKRRMHESIMNLLEQKAICLKKPRSFANLPRLTKNRLSQRPKLQNSPEFWQQPSSDAWQGSLKISAPSASALVCFGGPKPKVGLLGTPKNRYPSFRMSRKTGAGNKKRTQL